MKKTRIFPFLSILAAILLVMSLPRMVSEKGRAVVISILAPFWEKTTEVKTEVHQVFNKNKVSSEQIQRLETDNYALRRELKHLQEIVQHELYLTRSGITRSGDWQKLSLSYTQALPARVIYRNPSSWNSSCWLNVGKYDNERLGKELVAKNSPVVLGYSLVGVIDFVGHRQSRVRLLTDSGLTPSVRAVRGEPKKRMLVEQLNLMMDAMMEQDSLFTNAEQKMKLIESLEVLEGKLQQESEALYLAKGMLSGCSRPAWRSQGNLLKGTGFNCDFADELSPARDLRTGNPIKTPQYTQESILKVKDLLITTGMDGVFPAGLHVAEVVKISPLKEGDYYYELEAQPIAGNLDELSMVYVMPPVGYDPNEQPPLMGWE